MGRPPLPIGTCGNISVSEERRASNRAAYRAKTRYRGLDGNTRPVVRYGETKGKARDNLKSAIAQMQRGSEGLAAASTVAALADAWLEAEHSWRPNTRNQYRLIIEGQIKPRYGGVRLAEARPSGVSRVLTAIKVERGPSSALTAKKALTGMFRLAVLSDAIASNPVQSIAPISRGEREAPRALTKVEEEELSDLLRSSGRALELDLPDLVEFMLASGARIGEACAARAENLDLDAGAWEINATVIRETGVGLYVQERPKTAAGWRTITLPNYAVAMLKRRSGEERLRAPGGIVFGSPRAKRLRDPSNTTGQLREVLDGIDAGRWHWVTSHVFRKTVATRLDDAGLSARKIADHLGHAQPSMTLDVYMGRKVVSAEAARILDR